MKKLNAFIKSVHFDARLIVLLSLLMNDAELLECRTWSSFSKSYFKKYGQQILAYFGYKQCDMEEGKIKVEKIYATLFLNCIGYMIRDGIIPDCSFEEMAKHIDKIFEIGYSHDAVLTKLKEQNPECWQIEDAINSEKKRIKSKDNSKND